MTMPGENWVTVDSGEAVACPPRAEAKRTYQFLGEVWVNERG